MSGLLGVAYVDIRARLTNFESGLRAGVKTSMAAATAEMTAGGAAMNRAALTAETGLKTRLSGFVGKTGLGALGGQVSKATNAIGIPLKLGITAAAAAVTYESIKMAGNFQSQMNLLVSAAGEAQGAIKGMSSQVLGIARYTGTATTELTSGLYAVEKAGYRAGEATNVLKIGAEGARAEGANLATVITGLTSVMASYHIPASQASMAMNQIVAAAGESKTSMENFSSSLSTVIPIASAAHVSFAEVGGAIATLTQHGTSAAEATQELSSTIRNLQAPSQVAQKAMQQYGLSVVGVEKGLSDPHVGLVGTLQKVITTLGQHMGPAGLEAVSVFKKSESAVQDLQIMLGHMTPKLAGLSKQFLAGSLGLTDYRKEFRSLGATGASQGQQFLSLASQASGFNDLIKSGQPAMQTYVAALKSMLGGSIGLNTALQLTGPNMGGFVDRVAKISDASKNAGKDIATWGTVQNSFNVQMGKLHQTVDTAFISLGTKLLPVVSKASTATFNWLSHLRDGGGVFADTQKKFGPFAGAVDFIHTAFTTMITFVKSTVIPVVINIGKALEPVGVAFVHAAIDVQHFAADVLQHLADVLNHSVGPALVAGSKWIAAHGRAISKDIILIGQFVGILFGIGVAIKAYELAIVGATAVTGAFGGVLAFMSLAFTALRSGEIVAFVALYTDSVIAATIATGAQAVATGIATVATAAWAVATGLLDGAMAFLRGEGIAAAVVAFASASGIAAIATGLWTIAVDALDASLAVLMLNPFVAAAALIVGAIVLIVTWMTKGKNWVEAFKSAFSALANVFHDIMGAVGGFVKVIEGIFTLDPSKILSGLGNLAKGIAMIPVHLVEGAGKAIANLFGLGGAFKMPPIPIQFLIKPGALQKAAGDAKLQMHDLMASFKRVNESLTTVGFAKYDDAIKTATTSIKGQEKQLIDLQAAHKGAKIDINGTTVSAKQWQLALKDNNGDESQAIAMLMNMKTASAAYKTELAALAQQQKTFDGAIKTTGTTLNLTSTQVTDFAGIMDITANSIATGKVNTQELTNQIQIAQGALAGSSGTMNTLVNALFTYQGSAKGATDQTSLFKAALDALSGKSQDVNTSIAQANTQVQDLATSLASTIGPGKHAADQLFEVGGKAIKLSGSGAQLQTGMAQVKDQLENVATAVLKNGGTWQDAIAAYDKGVKTTLPQLQSQLHLSATQVGTLNSFLALTPQEKSILLSIPGLTQSTAGMDQLLGDLANFKSKNISLGIYVNTTGPGRNLINQVNAKTADRLGVTSANGNIFKAFASGGLENHIAQIAPAGAFRLWAEPETGGEAYIPLAGSKRGRSSALLSTVAKMFGGTFLNQTQMHAMGIKAFASGGFTAGQTHYSSTASYQKAHVDLEVKFDKTEFPDFLKSLGGSVSQVQNAAQQVNKALALAKVQGFGNTAYATAIENENKKLVSLSVARNAVAVKLKTANATLVSLQKSFTDESAKVAGTINQSFDITSAGNFNGFSTIGTIIGGLQTQAKNATTFSADIAKLSKSGLNKALVQQLSEAGPAALGQVQSLITATPAQIAQINALQTQVATAAGATGTATATMMYGAGIQAAQGLIKGLESQQAALAKTMTNLANIMVAQIKKDLGIHSPSTAFRWVGNMGGLGLVHGLHDYVGHVKSAASRLSVAATPQLSAAQASSGGGGGVTFVNHTYASSGMSETSLAMRVSSQQARQVRYGSPVIPGFPSLPPVSNVSPPVGVR